MVCGNGLLKNAAILTTLRCSRNTSERNLSDIKNQERKSSFDYDRKEVEHHESLAKIWWDSNGQMKALHAMNQLRIPMLRNGLINTKILKLSDVGTKEKYLTGVEILDVGCGGGILSESIARLGASVTGIDPSEKLTDLATLHAKNSSETFTSLRYIATTIEEHSKEKAHAYDAVVASEVIEHVPNKESFVKGCIKAVKPGGSLFFTTPNRTWMSWFGVIIMGEYVLGMVPKGTHQYDKFITHTELISMLEKEGCKIQLVNGMLYNVLSNKWHWTSHPSLMMYALHATCKN